jgi:hypothetical protein
MRRPPFCSLDSEAVLTPSPRDFLESNTIMQLRNWSPLDERGYTTLGRIYAITGIVGGRPPVRPGTP